MPAQTTQQPETIKMDSVCEVMSREGDIYSNHLQTLAKILNRLEEQTPTENAIKPPQPQVFGPGHLYRLHSMAEVTTQNNIMFNDLLNRLSRYI